MRHNHPQQRLLKEYQTSDGDSYDYLAALDDPEIQRQIKEIAEKEEQGD